MSALPTIRTHPAPSIADVALERMPQHLIGDSAWAHSATRHCTRELQEAIEGNRTFRIDRIIRGLATTPTIDQIEAVFSSVCEAIVANAYQQKSTTLRETLGAVEKAQRAAAPTLKALRGKDVIAAATSENVTVVVRQFATLIAMSDPIGSVQSQARAALAVRVAATLGLDDCITARCERAAQLGQLGALSLSHLRSKTEPLDESERKAVLEHPEAGARFCSGVPELADLATIIASQNESFDGSGNPRNLRGAEIPIEARIIRVADAFLAMTTQRAYRATCDVFEAMAAIDAGSGLQFDPQVVQAFLSTIGRRSYGATA